VLANYSLRRPRTVYAVSDLFPTASPFLILLSDLPLALVTAQLAIDNYFALLGSTIMVREQVCQSILQVAAIVQNVFDSEHFQSPAVSEEAIIAAEQLLANVADPNFLKSMDGQAWLQKHFVPPIAEALSETLTKSTRRFVHGADVLPSPDEELARPSSPMVVSPPPGLVIPEKVSSLSASPPSKRSRQDPPSFANLLGPLLGGAPPVAGPSRSRDPVPSPTASRARSSIHSPAVSRSRSGGSHLPVLVDYGPDSPVSAAEGSEQQAKKRKRGSPSNQWYASVLFFSFFFVFNPLD
jgi:hypothetical protein